MGFSFKDCRLAWCNICRFVVEKKAMETVKTGYFVQDQGFDVIFIVIFT
jgi:hypothetical protein